MDARVLTLEEAIDPGRKRVWIQLREMTCAMAARYSAEQKPFLRFMDQELEMVIEARAEYYGKTWRCFDRCPINEDAHPWEDGEMWKRAEE